jgi:hypothetical protein
LSFFEELDHVPIELDDFVAVNNVSGLELNEQFFQNNHFCVGVLVGDNANHGRDEVTNVNLHGCCLFLLLLLVAATTCLLR